MSREHNLLPTHSVLNSVLMTLLILIYGTGSNIATGKTAASHIDPANNMWLRQNFHETCTVPVSFQHGLYHQLFRVKWPWTCMKLKQCQISTQKVLGGWGGSKAWVVLCCRYPSLDGSVENKVIEHNVEKVFLRCNFNLILLCKWQY